MSDNYSILSFELKRLVKDPDRPLDQELPKFKQRFLEQKIELHSNYYLIWSDIMSIDNIGFDRILDTVLYFVKSKRFKYDANNAPDEFVWSIATATYWVRYAIFDPDIYKMRVPKNYEQLILIKFRNIGTELIKKGFNFRIPKDKMGNAKYVSYADAYLRQCRKRQIYLHRLAKARKNKTD